MSAAIRNVGCLKSRFGGNDESKKMQKYILKQQFEGFSISNTEGLQKAMTGLGSLQLMQKNQLALIKPKLNAIIATSQGILLEGAKLRELKITGGGMHGILETRMGSRTGQKKEDSKISDQLMEKDYPHRALKNKGIVDNGCSKHMTGNKAYLAEFQDFNGGLVAFGVVKVYILVKMSFAHENENIVIKLGAVKASICTASPHEGLYLSDPTNPKQDDSEIPPLEDIYQNSSDAKRTNHMDFHHVYLLVSCLNMTKKFYEALEDKAWVDAMQNNCLPVRRRLQKVWILVSLLLETAIAQRQEERIDYDVVFAPVARMSHKDLLAFASYMGFIVFKMDMKSAFLYGKIDEEVYVSQPPGFLDPKYPQKVYKVVKALYGLHQAPRALKDKHDIILVQVYVDDIIFGSTKKSWCDEFEALMKSKFQMSSMGELTFFLGLQVKQKADGIFISQDKYVQKSRTSFDFAISVIGSLMYLTASRPDILCWPVCACSRVSSFDLESTQEDSDYVEQFYDRKSQQEVVILLAGDSFLACQKSKHLDNFYYGAEYVAAASGYPLWAKVLKGMQSFIDHGFSLCAVVPLIHALLVNSSQGKVTPLFAFMLVQPTEVRVCSFRKTLKPQPTPFLLPTKTSGGNLRGHSSSDKSLSGNEGERAWEGRKFAKGESSVQRDPLFDEIPKDTIDHMEQRMLKMYSIKQISTDEQRKGTEEQIESTDEQRKGSSQLESAKAVSRKKEKGVRGLGVPPPWGGGGELKDIEETDRPKPTSTRSLLTLKPLPKIDLKDKGKKKIEEEDESESESDGIPEAEKKFKELASCKELRRLILAESSKNKKERAFYNRERANSFMDTMLLKEIPYQDEIHEGFDRVLWGDLMVMFNPDDEEKFWNSQQDWNIVAKNNMVYQCTIVICNEALASSKANDVVVVVRKSKLQLKEGLEFKRSRNDKSDLDTSCSCIKEG
ncbi:putative ribonuclease H-like domain-containing protein [Tanacetum coccineum]